MDAFISLCLQSIDKVLITFSHNWPFLVASTLIAVALKVFLEPQKVAEFLSRYKNAGVISATAAAVGTPLCSCGTTAVILGMMASMMPWAPIIAFMVASPLTSPEELVYSAGLFGWPFALAFFIASILLGLLGGLVANILESRGWLANQARYQTPVHSTTRSSAHPSFSRGMDLTNLSFVSSMSALPIPQPVEVCGCESVPAVPMVGSCACSATRAEQKIETCACESRPKQPEKERVTPSVFLVELYNTGGRLLVMFLGFAFIGYFLNGLIPPAWVSAIFGQGNVYSVPLAATLGLPLYINTESSLPLVRALIEGGMSQGSALAFLITGAGTSIGAMTGALTIARWRVIALVIGTLWVGAIAIGFAYDVLITLGLF
jgi:uncharacterized membrane protein YraQ (UPF0718 family)